MVSGRVARALPPATLSAPLQGALELLHLDSRARPQLITARSEGRGYGEAGGEGLFSSSKISEALTHRFAVPPLPQAGEGCCQLIFHLQTKMYKLQDTALSRAADEPKRIGL